MSAARLALAGGASVSLVAVLALAEPTIKKWEGYSNDPYRDITGLNTVCWGETAGVQARISLLESQRDRVQGVAAFTTWLGKNAPWFLAMFAAIWAGRETLQK